MACADSSRSTARKSLISHEDELASGLLLTRHMAIDETSRVHDWLRLVRAEYEEIPGLHLTEPQFRRLFGVDATLGAELLSMLVGMAFLRQTRTGGFVRAH